MDLNPLDINNIFFNHFVILNSHRALFAHAHIDQNVENFIISHATGEVFRQHGSKFIAIDRISARRIIVKAFSCLSLTPVYNEGAIKF